jgi:hypothetical protein
MAVTMSEYKGYNLNHLGTFPMLEIKAIGSGPVPIPLRGYFTTMVDAMKAVDTFLTGTIKELKDGKTKGDSKD